MEFTVDLESQLLKELIRRGVNIDLKPALRDAALYQERSLKTRIYQEITPAGQPFAPLRPRTLAAKKSGTILREKSILVNAFLLLILADQAIIKNPTFYGIFLHFGTYKMVARPFMDFSAVDKQRIEQIVEDYLRQRLQP